MLLEQFLHILLLRSVFIMQFVNIGQNLFVLLVDLLPVLLELILSELELMLLLDVLRNL